MDVHVPRYAANVFGVMFAAVGFGLSIFALILSYVVPQHQFAPEDFVYHSEKQIKRPTPGTRASDPSPLHRSRRPSHRNSQSSLSSSEGPPTPKDSQEISPKILRSASSPPSETETDHAHDRRPYILRKPTSLTFSQPPTSPPESFRNSPPNITKTVWVSSDVVPRKPSKLAGLTHAWKEHERKVPRQMSSPHLTHATPQFITAAARMQLASSKVIPCKRLEKILMLRRCRSLPSASASRPLSKKKRSQPLRTLPYEAPYFAPLPQPVLIEKREASSISRRRRPHRSQTLFSLTRRSTSSSFHNSDTDAPPVRLLPPSFSRQQT